MKFQYSSRPDQRSTEEIWSKLCNFSIWNCSATLLCSSSTSSPLSPLKRNNWQFIPQSWHRLILLCMFHGDIPNRHWIKVCRLDHHPASTILICSTQPWLSWISRVGATITQWRRQCWFGYCWCSYPWTLQPSDQWRRETVDSTSSLQELLITIDSSQEIMIMLLPQVLTHTDHTDTYVLALIAARLHHHLLQLLTLQFTDRVLPIEAWFLRAALLPLHSALDPKSKKSLWWISQNISLVMLAGY